MGTKIPAKKKKFLRVEGRGEERAGGAAEVCFDLQVDGGEGRHSTAQFTNQSMMQTRDRVNWNTLGKGWGGCLPAKFHG